MRIFLVGYMYCGKTTVGQALARMLGYGFVDLDQLFEQRYHTTIPIFFKRYDEGAFRILEQQILHSTTAMDDVVISTGGGTPCHADNMDWINAHGTSVYLDASVDCILARAAQSRKVRPVLTGMTEDERAVFVARQLHEREQYYRQAHHRVPADKPDLESLRLAVGG